MPHVPIGTAAFQQIRKDIVIQRPSPALNQPGLDIFQAQEEREKPPTRLLKNQEVRKLIPMSHGRLYALMDKSSPYHSPDFPTPIRLDGGRSVYWVEAEVISYIERNIAQSRNQTSKKDST